MDSTYEAVTIGNRREFGSYEVTREEMLEFAEQYDPLPFHTDPEAAQESMFGTLVASGWHTAAMTMRMMVDGYIQDSGAMGSPGIDELRWPNPVQPGDVLSVEYEPVEKEPWDEKRGLVVSLVRTLNQNDDVVQSMRARALYPRE